MSEAMIKRWNEIPLNRPEGPETASSSKRARARSRSPSSSDESEDNVSIVSRSPSPIPQNQKEEDISIYDQYVRGVVREPVTVDTKIAPTNKGFGMLAKMGWKEGEGLGVSGQGRTDPIPFLLKLDALGLGKASHDERIIESTVSQRRGLDSERMIRETEEQRKQREDTVAAKEQIKTEVKDTLRSFFCADCEKQYSNVAQYDEHLRSYAHAHVVRMKEQQATARQRQAGEAATRKAKEKRREEKEMKKMAAAAGIKLSSAPSAPSATIVPASQPIIKPVASSGSGFAPVTDAPSKRGGWSAVSTVAESSGGRSFGTVSVSTASSSGFKKTGWTAVGAAPAPAPVPATPEPASVNQTQVTSKASGGFTRGGWTTLETTSTADLDTEMASPTTSLALPIPPPPVGVFPVPPPPPPSSAFDPPPPPPDHSLPPPPPPDVPPPPPPDRFEPPPPPPPHPALRGPSGGYTYNPRSWNSGRRW